MVNRKKFSELTTEERLQHEATVKNIKSRFQYTMAEKKSKLEDASRVIEIELADGQDYTVNQFRWECWMDFSLSDIDSDVVAMTDDKVYRRGNESIMPKFVSFSLNDVLDHIVDRIDEGDDWNDTDDRIEGQQSFRRFTFPDDWAFVMNDEVMTVADYNDTVDHYEQQDKDRQKKKEERRKQNK
jgi:hypothetical protein